MRKIFSLLIVFAILLSLSPKQTLAAFFTDVPTTHSNYQEIMFLLEKGVINPGTKYGVNDKVTREEVAVMVSRAIGLNGKQTTTKFKDVPASLASSGYINSAVNAGIINGYSDTIFKPKALVTRGQMAAFISRGFKLTQEANIIFKDVSEGTDTFQHVRRLAFKNITLGYPDGTFKPNDNLTRAHISAFIARAMGFEKQEQAKTPIDRAVDVIISSPEFDGLVSDLYYQELLYGAIEISWQMDLGSGINTTINSWIVKDEKIIDRLWSGDIYNDSYWSNPYFGNVVAPYPPAEPEFTFTSDLVLIAKDGTYLGVLNTNSYDQDSVFNKYGTYGNKYSSKSIWNEYGTYGGKYGMYSAFNPYSHNPPAIVYENKIIGYLTMNKYHKDAISPIGLYELLVSLGL